MSLVGDIVGGIMGAGAAKEAAGAQQQGAVQAQGVLGQNQADALAAQQQALKQQQQFQSPYTTLGAGTANSLAALLAPGGGLAGTGFTPFAAPTAAEAAATPGYQFQLQQGMNALQNSAAARGGLLSEGTAKNLENYAQGLASANYQNAFQNALQGYQTNFGAQQQAQNNLYNRLMGATGIGQSSASQLAGLSQSGAQNIAGIDLTSGKNIADQINNAAAARASGIMGANNAWQNMIGGISNSVSAGPFSLGPLSFAF